MTILALIAGMLALALLNVPIAVALGAARGDRDLGHAGRLHARQPRAGHVRGRDRASRCWRSRCSSSPERS